VKDYGRYKRRINRDLKAANTRAKYGNAMKPAPVRVIRDGVEVVADQQKFAVKLYADSLESEARAAGYEGYEGYLHSAYWKSVRMQVLERDGHRCRRCGRKRNPLTIHHDRYGRVGHEKLEYLKALCWPCHRQIHAQG
jgi:hypothetical protein